MPRHPSHPSRGPRYPEAYGSIRGALPVPFAIRGGTGTSGYHYRITNVSWKAWTPCRGGIRRCIWDSLVSYSYRKQVAFHGIVPGRELPSCHPRLSE